MKVFFFLETMQGGEHEQPDRLEWNMCQTKLHMFSWTIQTTCGWQESFGDILFIPSSPPPPSSSSSTRRIRGVYRILQHGKPLATIV